MVAVGCTQGDLLDWTASSYQNTVEGVLFIYEIDHIKETGEWLRRLREEAIRGQVGFATVEMPFQAGQHVNCTFANHDAYLRTGTSNGPAVWASSRPLMLPDGQLV